MRIHLVKTAAGSTPSWMLSVFVVSMQFNYWIFQFIELIELIGLNFPQFFPDIWEFSGKKA